MGSLRRTPCWEQWTGVGSCAGTSADCSVEKRELLWGCGRTVQVECGEPVEWVSEAKEGLKLNFHSGFTGLLLAQPQSTYPDYPHTWSQLTAASLGIWQCFPEDSGSHTPAI